MELEIRDASYVKKRILENSESVNYQKGVLRQ